MQFKDFLLEMATVLRKGIPFGNDDIFYLNQFPRLFWPQALSLRYGELLIKALDNRGNLNPAWNDYQNVTLSGVGKMGRVTFKNIDTKISNVYKKLKLMGFDFDDPDLLSKTGAFHNFLGNIQNARRGIWKWEKYSRNKGNLSHPPKKFIFYKSSNKQPVEMISENPILVPGISPIVPNKLEKSRNDFDHGDPQGDIIWGKIEKDVKQEIITYLESNLNRINNPQNRFYINYFYWSQPQHKQKLMTNAIDYIKKNIKDPNIEQKSRRVYFLINFYQSAFQKGYATRRKIESAIKSGMDIPVLIQKYGPEEAGSMINRGTDLPIAAKQIQTTLPNRTIAQKRANTTKQVLTGKISRSPDDIYNIKMEFKQFIENSEQNDVKNSIKKLPKSYQKLVNKYEIKFEDGHNVKHDKDSIGFIDEEKKVITIASPWNYGREYTLLHEIGHIIWKYVVDNKRKTEWTTIVKNTKNKQKQNDEELFCMAFANYYAHHQIVIHHHDEWQKFIKNLPS